MRGLSLYEVQQGMRTAQQNRAPHWTVLTGLIVKSGPHIEFVKV